MEDLRDSIGVFIAERDWKQFHSPKNLAMALSVEASEIVEHFQWLTEEQSRKLSSEKAAKVREEIGDVMIYLTELAGKLGIDPVEAAKAKLEINRQKYPAAMVRGRPEVHGVRVRTAMSDDLEIFVFTAANSKAQDNLRKSIEDPIQPESVVFDGFDEMSEDLRKELNRIMDTAGGFYAWGAEPRGHADSTWRRMIGETTSLPIISRVIITLHASSRPFMNRPWRRTFGA